MNKWPVLGGVMIVAGLLILALLAGFIVDFVKTLLQIVAVFIGLILILGGFALILGRRWFMRAPWSSGPAPAST